MSVDTVLDRSGNVRDMRELESGSQKMLWEELPELSLSYIKQRQLDLEATVIYPDYAERFVHKDEDNFLGKNWEKLISSKKMNVDRLIGNLASLSIRGIELPRPESPKMLRIKKILEEYLVNYYKPETGRSWGIDMPRMLIWSKVLFPEIDIEDHISLESYNFYDIDFNKPNLDNNSLKTAAMFKLFMPSEFEGVNVKSSPLYLAHFTQAEELIKEIPEVFIKDVAYLKILASDEAEITPLGIKLKMPANLNLSKVSDLPEIERFET